MEPKSITGARYNLNYHLVWTPKYRRAVLTDWVASRLVELFKEIAEKWGVQMCQEFPVAGKFMKNHPSLELSRTKY